MDQTNQLIDEYTLAAFIAGTLSKQRRDEVIAYLAENAEARELLHMAYQAMETARQTDEIAGPARVADRPAHLPAREADRTPARPALRRLHGLSRYVVATVVVFTIGLGLRLAFGPPTDALRSPLPAQSSELTVQVSPSDLVFTWNHIPDAYQYRVVIWDPQEARVVARHETATTRLDEESAFVRELRAQLADDHTYTIRIDAVDAQNRLIQSSESIEFDVSG